MNDFERIFAIGFGVAIAISVIMKMLERAIRSALVGLSISIQIRGTKDGTDINLRLENE